MKLYNRMLSADLANKMLAKKKYVFISAANYLSSKEQPEKRGERIKEELRPLKYCAIQYFHKGVSKEGKIVEEFKVTREEGNSKVYTSLRKKEMCSFLQSVFVEEKILVVDFTLMNTRFLGAFCAILSLFQWDEVYFCYTEPGKYNKNEKNDYELKNRTMGFEQIPGLETLSDSSSTCDWVVFLGFEGARSTRLEGEAPASRRYSLPRISIPAMKTCWHNISVDANRKFFELKMGQLEKLDYVSAINPFETYNALVDLRKNNSVRLVISPIGPKPVMLGCIMYVIGDENEMLLYDNPYQEGNNTEEYGASHFYDLSYFIHCVKNKRFL